ncbi:MAG: hypothetical protein M3S32_11105 [Acidobacteriota bacterium]|nr:hypothetical protein [Acidobacteriota bacterium]
MNRDTRTAVLVTQSTPRAIGLSDVEVQHDWRRAAEAAIAALAERGAPFTSSDVLERAGSPPNSALLPTVIRAAHRNGWITKHEPRPLGAVWIGLNAENSPRARRADHHLAKEVWERTRERALREKISTGDILVRALEAYLKEP